MKSIFRIFVLALVVALLSGCFSVSTTVNLKKNGSGTIEEKIMVKPMNMFGQSQEEPESIYDEEELKAEAAGYGEDVKFLRGKEVSENGMNGYIAVYEFKDINKVKLNQNFAGKAVDLDEFGPASTEEINEFITFDFTSGSTSTLKIVYPEEKEMEDMEDMEEEDMEWEDEDDMEETDEAMMEMMKELYNGMKFSLIINFEGKIKETNASFQEGDSVILMDMDFGKLTENPELMAKMNNPGNMTQDELQEMMKDMEGIKFETQKELTVEFK